MCIETSNSDTFPYTSEQVRESKEPKIFLCCTSLDLKVRGLGLFVLMM